jgi:hypothetical protein
VENFSLAVENFSLAVEKFSLAAEKAIHGGCSCRRAVGPTD